MTLQTFLFRLMQRTFSERVNLTITPDCSEDTAEVICFKGQITASALIDTIDEITERDLDELCHGVNRIFETAVQL